MGGGPARSLPAVTGEELPPFQPLRARRAGLPLDTTLRQG